LLGWVTILRTSGRSSETSHVEVVLKKFLSVLRETKERYLIEKVNIFFRREDFERYSRLD